jgi:hypothetical protein
LPGLALDCFISASLLPGIETGVLNPRPKLLEFHMPGPATYTSTPNKEAWWRTEKGYLLHGLGYAVVRGRVSMQPMFSHLWGTDISYRFK